MNKRLLIGGIVGSIVGALLALGVVVARLDNNQSNQTIVQTSLGGTSVPNSGTESTLVIGEGDTLDLSRRGLTQVSGDVFSRTEIEKLNLSHNELTGALPAEVWHLKNLRVLDLSYNKFTGVPAEIGQLTELQVLDLSYNNLTGLPYELGNLVQLEVLDLRGNPYSAADLNIIKKTLPGSVRILVD